MSIRSGKWLPSNGIASDLRQRLQDAGFVILADVPKQEIVIGVAGQFWRPNGGRVWNSLRVATVLVHLLGWHWEFLPTFFAELVPGADLVPFWTLAVANVYRKWKQTVVITEERREQRPALKG